MANHRRLRATSIPPTRLEQSLPPVPLNDIPQITIQIPYRDDPDDEEEDEGAEGADRTREQGTSLPSQPPEYQPMYEYLRSKQVTSPNPPEYGASPSSMNIVTTVTVPVEAPFQPYRDEPFVVTIDSSPPPPSYNDLYRENGIEMDILERTMAIDGDPAEQTEEIYKWVVGMLLVTLTVASVGTAFNWGRP
ncbi:hypothetical protein BGZ60DRAFT_407749 [Tricladium varicosporioides]|nr:hypothetical protein BGZ60DRAFT_407749 [Hymenoscyphus varicosporioides]